MYALMWYVKRFLQLQISLWGQSVTMGKKTIVNYLYRINLSFRGNCLKNFNHLKELQWYDPDQVLLLQKEQLKKLLIHTYKNVPYYRKHLNNVGIMKENGDANLENFMHLPLLDKSTIRAHFRELISNDLPSRKWFYNTSGGSTGEPVRLIQDKDKFEWGQAVKMLFDTWTSYSLGDKKILLWGSERDLLIGQETIKTRIGRWNRNEMWLNAFRMTPEQMRFYAHQINEYQPVQILAYVESIYELARLIEREAIDVYSPKAIMTSAGTLYPYMREIIERIFKTSVFNRYGSREVSDIACECRQHHGLHVSMPTHLVEILKPDGTPTEPGEIGEIVVTLLTNYAMPLIRYRIGDMGAWDKVNCTCGCKWPLLKEVTGKVTDNFVKRNGSLINGGYFEHLLYFQDWIYKYQVVQEDYNLINVFIVLNEFSRNNQILNCQQINEIINGIRFVMGQDCNIEFKFVDDILPSPSGKYRFTFSKIYAQEKWGASVIKEHCNIL